jgi:hypothetical protein
MNQTTEPYRLTVRTVAVVAVSTLTVYFCIQNFLSTFRLDDDNLYYLISAISVTDLDSYRETFQKLLSCVTVNEAGDTEASFVSRLDLRYNYISNYTALSALWDGMFGMQPRPIQGTIFEAAAFTATFQWSQLVIVLAGLMAASAGAKANGRLAAIATAVVICAAMANFYVYSDRLTVGAPLASLQFVLSAPPHFNIFSFSPRGISAFALLIGCTWRWQGNFRVFYGILLALCFVHQSNATLIILTFLGLDAVMRPGIFRDKIIFTLVAAAVLAILTREELTSVIGYWTLIGLFLALGVAGAAAFRVAVFERISAYVSRKLGLALTTEVLDITAIVSVWLLTMPVLRAAVLNGYVDQFSGRYVFWQLHTRYGTLFLAVVLAGLAFKLWSTLTGRRFARALFILLVAGVAVFDVFTLPSPGITEKYNELMQVVERGLRDLDQAATAYWKQDRPLLGRNEEQILYYTQIGDLMGDRVKEAPMAFCENPGSKS